MLIKIAKVPFAKIASAFSLAFWILAGIARAAVVMESPSGGDTGAHVTLMKLSVEPARWTATVQPETMVVLRRMTDVAVTTSPLSANPKAWDGIKTAGLTNGYSRTQCVNRRGDLMLAFLVTPGAYLARMTDGAVLGMLVSKVGGKIGDKAEVKWSPFADEPTTIYYAVGDGEYKQDVLRGAASEVRVGSWGAAFYHTADGEAGAGLMAMATSAGVRVMDLCSGALLPGVVPVLKPAGVDVAPDGAWLKVDTVYYRMSDVRAGVVRAVWNPGYGHGGWSWSADKRVCFVQQSGAIDWLIAFFPDTGEVRYLMRMPEIGSGNYGVGIHVATDRYGALPGWALVSVYQTGGAFEANGFLIETKSMKLAGAIHNGANWVNRPAAEWPRIVRVCSMQHQYVSGEYFTEGWMSMRPDGRAGLWGGNWWGRDNLEVYQAEFPDELLRVVQPAGAPGPVVTPTPTATPTPEPGAMYAGGVVRWDAAAIGGTAVDLELFRGSTHVAQLAGGTRNDGVQAVTLPGGLAAGSYRAAVKSYPGAVKPGTKYYSEPFEVRP